MIETARLVLRDWRDEDLDPFAKMTADPLVMAHLGGPIDRAAAAAVIARQRGCATRDGFTFWAVERQADAAFLGFCGLRIGGHAGTAVSDELEIGWRFAQAYWGQGYALEAAQASINHGWTSTRRDRVTAWTVPANTASWGLMKRLGMIHRPELDFAHPNYPAGHPLSGHIVYTIDRPA